MKVNNKNIKKRERVSLLCFKATSTWKYEFFFHSALITCKKGYGIHWLGCKSLSPMSAFTLLELIFRYFVSVKHTRSKVCFPLGPSLGKKTNTLSNIIFPLYSLCYVGLGLAVWKGRLLATFASRCRDFVAQRSRLVASL